MEPKPVEREGTSWNTAAGDTELSSLVAPVNLSELVDEIVTEAKAIAGERVKPYQTPVTLEILRSPT